MLPLNISNFFKDPVKSILFLTICAVAYLYIDNKMMYLSIIEKQEQKIHELETTVDTLRDEIIKLTVIKNENKRAQ